MEKYSNFPSCTPTIKQLYKQLPNALMNNSFDILASTPNRQWHILFVWSLLCCSTWLGWVYKSSWGCFQWNSFILMLQLSLYMFITLLKLIFYAAKLPSHNDLHKKKEIYSKTICKYSMKKHCHYNCLLNLHAEMWMTLSFTYTEKCNLGCGIFNQNTQISDNCKTANFGLFCSIYAIMILFFR